MSERHTVVALNPSHYNDKERTGAMAPTSLEKGDLAARAVVAPDFCEAGAKAAAEARRVERTASFMVQREFVYRCWLEEP